jgi:hypothetical protein
LIFAFAFGFACGFCFTAVLIAHALHRFP